MGTPDKKRIVAAAAAEVHRGYTLLAGRLKRMANAKSRREALSFDGRSTSLVLLNQARARFVAGALQGNLDVDLKAILCHFLSGFSAQSRHLPCPDRAPLAFLGNA
ncbi:MAG: hypothetical protein WBQ63_00175 [Candidatus Acidiferrales bacterium]